MTQAPKQSPAPEKRDERPEETAVRGLRQKTGEALTGEQEKAIAEFLAALKKGKTDEAIALHSDHKDRVNFAACEGYDEALRIGFLYCFRAEDIFAAHRLKNAFILDKRPWFCEAVKEGFRDCMGREGYIKTAARIAEEFGLRYEILTDTECLESIKEAFLKMLRKGQGYLAGRIVETYEAEINFGLYCMENAEAVQEGMLQALENGQWEEFMIIRNSYESRLLQTSEKRSARKGFLKSIEEGRTGDAESILEAFEKESGLMESTAYEEAVKRGFLKCLEDKRSDDAFRMIEKFGQGMNLTEIPGSISRMSDAFADVHATEAEYLGNSEANTPTEAIFSQRPPDDEMLFYFRLCMAFVTTRFKKDVSNKIKQLGSPTGDPAELSEQDQAKLQAFAANLHTELSVKIRLIASPELIRAYLAQNSSAAGSEFLTQAA